MMISSSNCSRNFPLCFPSLAISVFGCSKLPLWPSHPRTSVGVSAALAADTQTLPQSAIQRIAEKLRSLGYVEEGINKENPEENQDSYPVFPSPGEIFVPLRSHLPKHRVGHTLDPSWSTPEYPVPEPGSGDAIQRFHELRRGVLKEKEEERLRNQKKERAPTLAELKLSVDEIKRLTSLGIGLKKRLKVGKAGITEGIVNGIHERWRRYEIVRIACEDICRLNMKRTHDLLERKTGGLVIWRSGSNIILYRGADYKFPYFLTDNTSSDDSSSGFSLDTNTDEGANGEIGMSSQGNKAVESPVHNSCMRVSGTPVVQGVGLPNRFRFQLPGEALLAEEADKLLQGLGPRFSDWWGFDPLPVDADLLPAIVPGYRKPFRLLPYGVKPKLTNDEMTTLRRLGLPLPCHFALGRNRKLQGLAASIVKLWEKCEIAKIAIKRGIQNTNSELMAEELKALTGGTLLSRDKEFIALYRGKDFLPIAVSSAIEERRQGRLAISQPRTDNNITMNTKEHATNEYSPEVVVNEEKDQKCHGHREPRKLRLSEAAIERTSAKMNIALAKKARAEKLLEGLEKEEISQPPEADKEGITEEERYMLRRVGLRMGPFLLMGRRGVFDGTVENMHLHWKYRELVKILIGRRSIEEVHQVAQTLEAESGGILVAVEQVNKGYAIIIYRGKNYKRPASLRPRTLLSKREALKRSIEAQRRQSLKLHVLELTKNIDELKLKMAKDKDTNDLLLAKDLKLGFIKEPEFGEIYVNEDKSFDKDRNGEDRSHFKYLAEEEKIRENQETDANSVRQVHSVPSSNGPVSVGGQGLTRDILHSDIDGKDARGMPKEEPQPMSAPKYPQDSLNIAERRIDFSLRRETRDHFNTSATTSIQPHFPKIDRSKADLEYSAGKATQNESTIYRATQLSNRERLVLRKQALRMKNRPVLAVGKRNIMSGIAKTINAHFKKHSLAIVSIKGRAEGTSIREVVHNLEQATGSVLVSQEPTKIILYKRRESEEEPIQDGENTKLDSKNYTVDVGRKGRGLISPELMSAIRMECGLKLASEATDDGGSGYTDVPPSGA